MAQDLLLSHAEPVLAVVDGAKPVGIPARQRRSLRSYALIKGWQLRLFYALLTALYMCWYVVS